jgi:hypothetical protein
LLVRKRSPFGEVFLFRGGEFFAKDTYMNKVIKLGDRIMRHKLAAFLLATTSFMNLSLVAAAEGREVDFEPGDAVVVSALRTEKRPEWMKKDIVKKAAEVANVAKWTHNGNIKYGMGFVDEHKLILKLIAEAIGRGQKELWVLDIGCAEFKWGKQLLQDVNNTYGNQDIDVHVHIVGLTGARDANISEVDLKKKGICQLHVFEQCPIEILAKLAQTSPRYAMFNGKIRFDAIVSRSTFRHFVDPLGTLTDVLSTLLSGAGIVLCELPIELLNPVVLEPLSSDAYWATKGFVIENSCSKGGGLLVVWGDAANKELASFSYAVAEPQVNESALERYVFNTTANSFGEPSEFSEGRFQEMPTIISRADMEELKKVSVNK